MDVITLLHVLLKLVTKCLATQADTAHDSKPITVSSHKPYQPSREPISAIMCTHIGPSMHPQHHK